MQTAAHCVSVVLDGEYGDGLVNLLQLGPIWIVDTDTNRVAAEIAWTRSPNASHLEGVTLFRPTADSTEDMLFYRMDEIDLHHGVNSADPPYTVLNVVCTPITDRLRANLGEYGFHLFHSSANGFLAVRPLPEKEVGESYDCI